MSDDTAEDFADHQPAEPEPQYEQADVRTGIAAIDAALDSLTELDTVDITEHPQAYDSIHGVLREALAHAGRPEDTPSVP